MARAGIILIMTQVLIRMDSRWGSSYLYYQSLSKFYYLSASYIVCISSSVKATLYRRKLSTFIGSAINPP